MLYRRVGRHLVELGHLFGVSAKEFDVMRAKSPAGPPVAVQGEANDSRSACWPLRSAQMMWHTVLGPIHSFGLLNGGWCS